MSRRTLTHLDARGAARMVDVAGKDRTVREAVAEAFVRASRKTLGLVRDGLAAKGDVLAVARIAGIAAAKRAPDLIPLCHPVALTAVAVDLAVERDGIRITATARAADRTGVEMEALTAVTASALTVYDMLKSAERGIVITDVRLLSKTGGKSGTWRRSAKS